MSKDPALLFYTSDFLTETYLFTDDQIGKYIKLICLQHQFGFLTIEDLNRVAGTDEKILKKFENRDGKFYNAKIFEESERRKKYSESRRKNRQVIDSQSNGKNICKTYEKHMETETISNNIIKNNNSNWEEIKKNFFRDFRWKEKFCMDKGIKIDQLETWQQEFIQNIELSMDFKTKKELYHHFTYWALKNKIKKNESSKHSKASRGAYQLLEELRSTGSGNSPTDNGGPDN